MRMFASMKRLNAPLVPIRPIASSVVLLSLIVAACGGGVEDLPGAKGDLLAGRSPSASTGAKHVSRMTDGFVANDGGFWRTDMTALMPMGASVVWDLGEVKPITCAYLQGDNNDTYEL